MISMVNCTTRSKFFTEVQNHVYELMENTNWFTLVVKLMLNRELIYIVNFYKLLRTSKL